MTTPDPSAQSGAGDPQSGADSNGQGTGQAQDPNAQSGGTGQGQAQQQPDPALTVSRAEFDALQNRLRAADQKRAEAEGKLQQLVDKDLPAQEKLQRDLDAAAAARDTALAQLKESRLENAFLKENTKYKWKNPSAALKLADLSKVEVLDDGTVTNLGAALDALAKSDPYLIDTEAPKEEPKGSTGAPGTGGQAGKDASQVDMKAMAARIPALRSRGIGG